MATISPLFLAVLLLAISTPSTGQVPKDQTFRFVNEGYLFDHYNEYSATYRSLDFDRFGNLFTLAFYNTTPDRFYLGLRMGGPSTEEPDYRWIWDANRGRPVGENSTLTFGRDGNLVIAEANGRVVWSTGTANKGAVGIRILPVGNIVIYDKHDRFLWQSFDHPTDTLMVGQSLYLAGGPNKLVSRRSETDNSDGVYSLVLHSKGVDLYVASSSSPKSLMQYSDGRFDFSQGTVTNATLVAVPVNNGAAYEVSLKTNLGMTLYTRPKYNATLSFLRVEMDGNLAVYTYYIPVDYSSWERSYYLFGYDIRACRLPGTCGDLGLCKNGMCVACPSAKGLLGWDDTCKPPALAAPCSSGARAEYFKMEGVENYVASYNKGLGKMKVEECRRRCSSDCKCLGFFYWEETSDCWLAPTLGSLYGELEISRSHVLYVKYFK